MFIHRHKLASRALSAIAAVAVALAAGPRGDAEARRPEAHLQPGWVDQQRLDNAAGEPQNWMTYGGTYAEQRYSTLHQIDEGSIGRSDFLSPSPDQQSLRGRKSPYNRPSQPL